MIRNQLLAEKMTRGWKPTDARTRAQWTALAGYPEIFVIVCKIVDECETI